MAIRDKVRRALGSRKSITSSSSSSESASQAGETASTLASTSAESEHTAAAAPPAPAETAMKEDAAARRHRAFTWRSSKSPEEKKRKQKRSYIPDPRERPFTETNLRYQEILGSYEMTFGTSRTEQLWDADGEISPGTSRQNSVDLARGEGR